MRNKSHAEEIWVIPSKPLYDPQECAIVNSTFWLPFTMATKSWKLCAVITFFSLGKLSGVIIIL